MSVFRDAVSRAMREVARVDFLPPEQRSRADDDVALPIAGGQSCSQPRTVAAMLRLLDVRPGHRILDVGSGSGWSTALLGTLTGPTGSVDGVELDLGLAAWGAGNVAAYAMPWVRVQPADPAHLGLPSGAPYDRILVSADGGFIPPDLVEQLIVGGVMVLPVDGVMTRLVRTGTGAQLTTHGDYRFVPLR
uniref:Protein-L-isoaspartate O-methyltransferase n=1 Tax=uncultured Nocardioidaceae bacterium TaxID=253824 RepID=A0A6J4L706_9ACTN|nr:MAG: Protein-L-isoaspartate O-methyltransferase [uncultured Nocardioidaceae bacterium]